MCFGEGVDLNVVPHTRIIKGTDAEQALGEGCVLSLHDRRTHVIKVDRNLACGRLALDFYQVPSVVLPGRAFRGLARDLSARFAVDDEDLIRMIVRFLTQVHVVEMGRVLIAKEETQVAMTIARVG